MPSITFRSYTMAHSTRHYNHHHHHHSHSHYQSLSQSLHSISSESSECSSTMNVCEVAKPPQQQEQQHPAMRRRVQFQEEGNEYHENTPASSAEACWYNKQDYARFHADTAAAFRTVATHFSPWTKNLVLAYEAYGFATSIEDVQRIRHVHDGQEFPLQLLGLDKFVLITLTKSLAMMRQQLYREVHYWQQAVLPQHNISRDEYCSQASCRVSQQAKLWAQHTARLSLYQSSA